MAHLATAFGVPSVADPGLLAITVEDVLAVTPRRFRAHPLGTAEGMGITDKISGRVKKAAGDLTDDASLRAEGRKEERKGEAKEELARDQARADRTAEAVANLERRT